MRPYIVAMTGASGVVYGVRFLQALAQRSIPAEVVISDTARLVLKEELEVDLEGVLETSALCGRLGLEDVGCSAEGLQTVRFHDFKDFTAPIASGSYPVAGMVVVPCSMGTLGAIAGGLSQNLIHRAADCTLKEGRKLVLVPRETPLSAIHLENMLKLARLGVRIVPAMPAFYSESRTVNDLVDFVVGKTLDQLGIPHSLYPRWIGSSQRSFPDSVSGKGHGEKDE